MNRDQAKNLLYLGSEFSDDKVNQVAVDFMYQARVLDLERKHLLLDKDGASTLDDENLRIARERLAEARYTLLRDQVDLYQPANRRDTAIPDDALDDFDEKRDLYVTAFNKPVYTPAEMAFLANTGSENAWTCFKADFWRCPMAAIATLLVCGILGGPVVLIIGLLLLVAALLCYHAVYVPYAMKQAYVRRVVFPVLIDPRRDYLGEIDVQLDDKPMKRSLKNRHLHDAGLWYARPLGFPSAWLGVAIGASCALPCLLIATLVGMPTFFSLVLSLVALIVAIVQIRKDDVLAERLGALRASLRRSGTR